MRSGAVAGCAGALLLGGPRAFAQAQQPAASTLTPAQAMRATPPPKSGFRGAIDLGLSYPVGKASGTPGDALGSRYSPQFAMVVGGGIAFLRSWFVGAYAGVALGGPGYDERLADTCGTREGQAGCSSSSFMGGVEAQFSLFPAARYNPWLGYGFGYEYSRGEFVSVERDEKVSSGGITFARLRLGLDVRQKVGFGPFAQAALGRFTSTSTIVSGAGEHDLGIDDRTVHAWLTLGLRVVINP